eukprot:gnl/MRDRNA2_/MRDRNA2_82281_c0_seq2.p1 gnl/MRDRNA2_/MRDRNA2_82281_c0~~gnl/MRDRNA2_/MRDRNA2_82281_c0_seq2.p1  ORF type:complete len:309 (+),score=45.35 gnl/MRDRNA2_/MRDRNA2_82281_c0_seq2:132-1058(+)
MTLIKVSAFLIVAGNALKLSYEEPKCSKQDFEKTQNELISQGLMKNTHNAEDKYDEFVEAFKGCKTYPVTSKRKMLVNIGEGTTATRYVDTVFEAIGFKALNFKVPNAELYKSPKFDYISDNDVPYQVSEIIQRYPNAIFIMSMRDGEDWRTSRIKHHIHDRHGTPVSTWHPAFGCEDNGKAPVNMYNESAAAYFTAREIWWDCVLKERLFQFNLFESANPTHDTKFFQGLKAFLEKHGYQKPNWEHNFQRLHRISYEELVAGLGGGGTVHAPETPQKKHKKFAENLPTSADAVRSESDLLDELDIDQ